MKKFSVILLFSLFLNNAFAGLVCEYALDSANNANTLGAESSAFFATSQLANKNISLSNYALWINKFDKAQDSAYYNLNAPFIKSAFVHNFIFYAPDSAISQTHKKKPKFNLNPNLMPLKPRRANFKIRGSGRTKMGEYLSDIVLDSARNRTLTNYSVSEVSISQGYLLPLKGTPFENIELTGGYTMLANNEHRVRTQIKRDYRYWDFAFGYDFSNTDLSQTYGNRIDSYYTNHALRAKLGLNHNSQHKYSVNFTYQKGEKSGLLKSYGEIQNVWSTPNYDRISAYILGNSAISSRVSLKSKLYYNSFLNISRVERIFGDTVQNLSANAPHSNSTNNYTWGLTEILVFSLGDSSKVRLGVNLRRDNLKYTSQKYGEKGEIVATRTALSDISTTIFAEYAQKITQRIRFSINGSYDRNDMFHSVTNNIIASNLATQDWTLQGVIYVDVNDAWLLYINAMKNSQVPTLKDFNIGSCGARTMNPYSIESTFVYSIGTCVKW